MIEEIKPYINQALIEHLENLLEDAKRGDIVGIGYALLMSQHRTGNGWVGADKGVMSMLGELRALEHDFVQLNIDLRANEGE